MTVFYVLDSGGLFCVIDGAEIGPSYNPGHAHSDNFTYELFLDNKRVIVDSGTYAYDNDSSRAYFRSTDNHNTVVINDLEQSQVWAGFRVAKRSNPTFSKAGQIEGCLVFNGRYKNMIDRSQGICHERMIVIKPSKWMLVWDIINAKNKINSRNHIHFAPEWRVSKDDGHILIKDTLCEEIVCIPINISDITVAKGLYAQEFGKKVPVDKLTFLSEGKGILQSGYMLVLDRKDMRTEPIVHCSESIFTIKIGTSITRLNLWN